MKRETLGNGSQPRKMPVLFIGHGSPLNLILKNDFTESLSRLGRELPKPRAIIVISAHWLTDGNYVTCAEKPRTIYDFYGFPDELYDLKYPCLGSTDTARLALESVRNVQIKCDYDWGLDHASWAILRHMYPRADIPVAEMSINYSPINEWHPKSLKQYYDLASELALLREKGVLIIGSGNIVHNLGLIDYDNIDASPFDWAAEFDEKVKRDLIQKNHVELFNCQNTSRAALLSTPTLDHYIPMIYVIALQGRDEPLKFVYEGFQYGSVSMRCFQIG